MDLPEVLQRLDRLDKSSFKFPNRLTNLLNEKEYKSCIRKLKGDQVAWLVEYLDNVCSRTVFHLLSAQPA